jgi:glutamate racemase
VIQRDRPIGVFDSGIGGLAVLRALMQRLPRESFVYLGDTARLPYGSKSPDTVTRYAVQCAEAVATHDIKLLVVACNTASAVALPALERTLAPVPVIGVIQPGAEAAVAAAPHGEIAVIATEGTVKGGAYVRAIHQRLPNARVTQQACPLFVALAEEGLTDGPIAELVAQRYLEPLLGNGTRPDCLVLGCTHFPALAGVIARVAGPDIVLVDSAATTAAAVARLLGESNLMHEGKAAAPRFLATDSPERFARVAETFLGTRMGSDAVELVDLQKVPSQR